jgi:hypothetical protein
MMELRERGENGGGEPELARHPRGDHGQRCVRRAAVQRSALVPSVRCLGWERSGVRK